MSYFFRPGSRNTRCIVRPMQEPCLQSPNGAIAAGKLLGFFKNNQLEKDGRYLMPKGQGPPIKWHETNGEKNRRKQREPLWRQWDIERTNTAEMALWWRYRAQAPIGSYSHNVYKEYLENEINKKKEEYYNKYQIYQNKKYTNWDMDDMLIDEIEPKRRYKSPQEKEYMESLQPDSQLEKLRYQFNQQINNEKTSFNQWKNDINIYSIENKQYDNRDRHRYEDNSDIMIDQLSDPNLNLNKNEKILIQTNANDVKYQTNLKRQDITAQFLNEPLPSHSYNIGQKRNESYQNRIDNEMASNIDMIDDSDDNIVVGKLVSN